MSPRYDYNCTKCDVTIEVMKSMSEASSDEFCGKCNLQLQKVISAPRINTSICQFQAHFNHGLGKVVKSKADIKDELRRINGETGRNIVEVGNDNLQSIKTQRKKYTVDQ